MKSLRRIVVIEDEPALLNLLVMLLKRASFDAVGFQKGSAALQYISKNRVDLVLVDINLPDIDGVEICQMIKNNRKTNRIPVVVITSAPTKKNLLSAKKAGVQDFISKIDLNFEDFLDKIKNTLDISAGTRAEPSESPEKTSPPGAAKGSGKKTPVSAGKKKLRKAGASQEGGPIPGSGQKAEEDAHKREDAKYGSLLKNRGSERPKAVIAALKRIKELRTLPFIAIELARKASNQESSATDLLKTVELDQALTYKILKVANSPLYCANQKINSMQNAIVRIGFERVKEIALGAAILDNIGDNGGGKIDRMGLWEHSLATSIIAGELARMTGGMGRDLASIAAFLHDFGKVIFDDFLEALYEEVAKYSKSHQVPVYSSEMHHLGLNHATLFTELRITWNLPEKLYFAVAYHHNTWDDLKQLNFGLENSGMILVVKAADILAKTTGVGDSGDDYLFDIPSWVQNTLGMEFDTMVPLLERTKSNVNQLKEALGIGDDEETSPYPDGSKDSASEFPDDVSLHSEDSGVAWIDDTVNNISPFRLSLIRLGVNCWPYQSLGELIHTIKGGGGKPDIVFIGPETAEKTWENLLNITAEQSRNCLTDTRFVLLYGENREIFKLKPEFVETEKVRIPISMGNLHQIILSRKRNCDPVS